MKARPLRVAIIAGEESGNQLGARLVQALRAGGREIELLGVGGTVLAQEGLVSLFDQADLAVNGVGPVLRRLPLLLRRIRETARFVIAQKPDILVTIDSPDFCKRVAKRVRVQAPEIPIVHWVCPSVWAWRPGRAPKMRAFFDHILCLLPFEPAALARLNGPPGTYTGHPLIERLDVLRPQQADERAARADASNPVFLVLPGSRSAEIRFLLPVFIATMQRVETQMPGARWILPTLPRLEAEIRALLGAKIAGVEIVTGEAAKLDAMRRARVALAASGTVTLELALAQVPMVVGYKVSSWEAAIARRLIKASSAVLANLILEERAVPEYLQEACEPVAMSAAFLALAHEGTARKAQMQAFARLEAVMQTGADRPSARAAEIVLRLAAHKTIPALPGDRKA